MLANLENALFNKNISKKALAAFLGVTEKTIQNKINEDTILQYPEAVRISTELFPEYDMRYLFASDNEMAPEKVSA